MAQVNLTRQGVTYGDGPDSVAIYHLLSDIRGGKSLDVSGFSMDNVFSGHIVIQNTTTKEYKPLGVTTGAYVALPEGHVYAGVVINTMPKSNPTVGIMTAGTVNPLACKVPYTQAIMTAMKAALPKIDFLND